MNPLDALGQEVARQQDAALEDADAIGRARAGFLSRTSARRAPAPARRRLLWAAPALGAAALAAALLLSLRPRPLEFRVGEESGRIGAWIEAREPAGVPLRFSDESSVLLAPKAGARVAAVHPDGATVVLEQGRVQADITHRERTRWSFKAGPFEVRVTGTRFDLAWDPQAHALALTMHQGSVQVGGCGVTPRTVVAGETLRLSCRDGNGPALLGRAEAMAEPKPEPQVALASASVATSEPLPTSPLAACPDPLPAQPAAARPRPRSARPPTPLAPPATVLEASAAAPRETWRDLADAGRFAEALAQVEATGFDAECERAGARDLLALGDVARLAARADRSAQALLALRQRFPGAPEAAQAAFALGRDAFDRRGVLPEAADWFETSLREQPDGPLSREAMGRLIEARQRAGDLESARGAANLYLARFPSGPHAALARSLLAEADR